MSFELLCVVNQFLTPEQIRKDIDEAGKDRVLVVSTHHLLPNERNVILGEAREVRLTTMTDWLDDAVMESIDEQTASDLQEFVPDIFAGREYPGAFSEISLRRKNKIVLQRVQPLLAADCVIHYMSGLGVSDSVWKEAGGERIPVSLPPPYPEFVESAAEATAVSADGERWYLFVTSTRRVSFADNVDVRRGPLPPGFQRMCLVDPQAARASVLDAAASLLPDGARFHFTTTVHEYRTPLTFLGWPLHIVVDGYHPPNYTRSYLDYFSADALFEVREPVSAVWFSRHGWVTSLDCPILKRMTFDPPLSPSAPRMRVLFALNHAGDWSALVNRSDTDLLVEAAAHVAANVPGVDVRVRTHPSMDYTDHEGPLSRHRIRSFIDGCGLDNLSCSSFQLSEDLDWAELVVSEYSQVLIDAFTLGKLGLIANLTGRRSYLDIYESFGFDAVTGTDRLVEAIAASARHPVSAVQSQSQAAARANTIFAAARGEAVSCPVCDEMDTSDVTSHPQFPPARLRRCKHCGHTSTFPEPSSKQVDEFKATVYQPNRPQYIGEQYLAFLRERAAAQIAFIESGWAAEDAGSLAQKRLIDLGCGLGTLVESWTSRGRMGHGIDENYEYVEYGRRRLQVDVRTMGVLADLPWGGQWDVITLSHVLEHLPELDSHMQGFRRLLAPGGRLFIEVPNTVPASVAPGFDAEGHLHFFTPGSLAHLIQRAKLRLLRLETCGPSFNDLQNASPSARGWNFYRGRMEHVNDEGLGLWIRCLACGD